MRRGKETKKRTSAGRKHTANSVFVIFLSNIIILSAMVFVVNTTDNASAGLIWTQNTEIDFAGGVLNGTEVMGIGDSAHVRLSREWVDTGEAFGGPIPRSRPTIAYDSANDVTVLFGGANKSFSGYYLGDTWIYDMKENEWTQKNPDPSPAAREEHAMVYDSENEVIILFGGTDNTPKKLNDTWIYDVSTNTWTNVSPVSSPLPRCHHAMAYDSFYNKVVLFGGTWGGSGKFGDTWIYDTITNVWTLKSPSPSPPARFGHAMTYDEANKVVVLFGGSGGGNDVWVYNVSADKWMYKMAPVIAPTARSLPRIAYDNESGLTILFGGLETGTSLDDTWTYNTSINTWNERKPLNSPTARNSHSMTYDSASDLVIMYGGWGDGPPFPPDSFGDLWVYDSNTNEWIEKTTHIVISPREGHTMVYMEDSNITLLFGGYNGAYFSDMWTYDQNTNILEMRFQPYTPSPRYNHAAVYADTIITMIGNYKSFMLFGGYDGSYSDETWFYQFDINTWTRMYPVNKPSARSNSAMAYDSTNDLIVQFGGFNGSYLGDTWIYNKTTYLWEEMFPVSAPSPREEHAMVYDSANGEILLFGGYNGSFLSDVWTYYVNNNTWIQRFPSITPSPRKGHSMSYNSADSLIVLFGGYNGTSLGDTWIYDSIANTWTPRTPVSSPAPRYNHSIACDDINNVVILFGGFNDSSFLDDTWIYGYQSSGTYTSSMLDTGDSPLPVSYYNISWHPISQPSGTEIKFQIATNNDTSTWDFVGPDGLNTSYYTGALGQVIWSGHNGKRYLKYRAYLTTTTISKSPILDDISITYDFMLLIDYIPWDPLPASYQKVSIGSYVDISLYVKNNGGGNATSDSVISFYNQSTPGDPFDTHIVTALSSGEISPVRYSSKWVAPSIPGTYYVVIEVDYYNDITESNEDNNTYIIEFEVVNVPITQINVGLPQYYKGLDLYASSSTQLTFTVVDNSGTGIRSTYYKIDSSGDWINYSSTGPFTVPSEGLHTIYYNSTDNLGGAEDTKVFEIIIDNTPPATGIDISNPKYTSSDTWVSSATLFGFTSLDGGLLPVGINQTKYKIWDRTWSSWNIYQDEFTLGTNEGIRYVEFYSEDWLGNAELINNKTYIVDNTPPTTIINVGNPKHINGDTWVTSATEISLATTDDGLIPVGTDYTEFRIWNNGSWTMWGEYSSDFTLDVDDGITYVEFYSVDYLGNRELTNNRTYVVDNTPPVTTHILQFEPDNTEAWISLIPNDAGSGVNYTKYRIDTGEWTNYSGTFMINESGWHAIFFWSADNLGNVEVEKSFTIFIEEPEIIVTPGDGEKEFNWKPIIALVFTIILLLVGSYVANKKPLKILKGNRLKTWLLSVLPFALIEGLTGIISIFTGIFSIPPLLGAGTVVDLSILIIGLVVFLMIYKKWGIIPSNKSKSP